MARMQHRFDLSDAEYAARRRAVSMMEVLTVISILVFLLALLVPGLGAAREHARRVLCQNNLRQWGTATQFYRDDNHDYLPTEGTYLEPDKPYAWFDVLPPYLNAPAYREVEGVGKAIREFPELHMWICPSKNLSRLYKSKEGKNQFHYGMNAVLDGMGPRPNGSVHTPGFPDQSDDPIRATLFLKKPSTVYMFDIYSNKSCGYQADVATAFHRGIANVLFLGGAVNSFRSRDFVVDGDFRRGVPIWNDPRLYWGYLPKPIP